MSEAARAAGLPRPRTRGRAWTGHAVVGQRADYYVDLRRATLHHEAGPLIGSLMRELTADLDFASVGGLTLGADPVATSIMHAPGRPIDAFVVRRKAARPTACSAASRAPTSPDAACSSSKHVDDRSVAEQAVNAHARPVRRWWASRPSSTGPPGADGHRRSACPTGRCWA